MSFSQQQSGGAGEKHAIRRLHKDWKELDREKDALTTINALPTSDIFVWHCNLRPDDGPFAGTTFHLILRFPQDYPHSPPDVKLCSHLSHPNVFSWTDGEYYICLDMIQSAYTSQPYVGWTSAYSILSLLLQLQSFLFAENIPQNYGGHDLRASSYQSHGSIGRDIAAAEKFRWNNIEAHDGTIVSHSHSNPWPPLGAPYKGGVPRGQYTSGPPRYSFNDGTALTLADWVGNSFDAKLSASATVATATSRASSPSSIQSLAELKWSVPEAVVVQQSAPAVELPLDVLVHIFTSLDPKGLLQARNVCRRWRSVIVGHNLFERSQIMCFHTKATLDDKNTVLGVGLIIEYHRDGTSLKGASSPLDLLSQQAFDEEGVRTGVWGGSQEAFSHFLPLVLNEAYAAKGVQRMQRTMCQILQFWPIPGQPLRHGEGHTHFHPFMAFQLLANLMNTMVVELMNSAQQGTEVHRHASEKALEGYCAFHHMLLYFAKKYPIIGQWADQQVNQFLASPQHRHKNSTPNLGVFIICLTLSRKGWDSCRVPLVKEVFDRNVRWILPKYPALADRNLGWHQRLEWTFLGASTSLRLLMFQVQFLTLIGRPAGTKGPFDVLALYEKRMGKPTTALKEDLQSAAKEILEVASWVEFFKKLGGDVPARARLVEMLEQAITNSKKKGYHRSDRRHNGQNRGRNGRGHVPWHYY